MKPLFAYQGHCGGRHPDTSLALQAHNLTATYREGNGHALRGVSFEIARGQRVALVGANGAGKSTLLRVIAATLPLVQGELKIFGHRAGACRHQVAFLTQRSGLDWSFPVTVEKLVLGGRYVHMGWFKRPGKQDRERVQAALELLKIDNLADRQIGQLSGGQQQRALLARALVHEADLLLLDEPLNAVDSETRKLIGDVLDALREQGKTVLIATHDIDRGESEYDQALYLSEGELVNAPEGYPDFGHCSGCKCEESS